MHNTAVCVLGMHRSGTSALAGALRLLGVTLGESLLPQSEDNPRGFWEHADIVDLHKRLLSSLGSSWDDVRPLPELWWTDDGINPFRDKLIELLQRDFAEAQIWGVKDPRMCKLIPLWQNILNELGCESRFILIHRHPIEVARSLKKRNGFTEAKSGLLWLEHNLLAENWTRGQARLFIRYDQLLADRRASILKIANFIRPELAQRGDQSMAQVADFLTPQLRNHAEPADLRGADFGACSSLVAQCHQSLNDACHADTDAIRKRFDTSYEGYEALTAGFDAALASHAGDLQRALTELRERLDRVQSTVSWQLLRPLRRIERLLGRLTTSTSSPSHVSECGPHEAAPRQTLS